MDAKEYLKVFNVNFYKTKQWKEKRIQILIRDNYECQRCKANGKYSKATTVHHIKHYSKFPSLALTDDNLISLCNTCHNEVHPEKFKDINMKVNEIHKEKWE